MSEQMNIDGGNETLIEKVDGRTKEGRAARAAARTEPAKSKARMLSRGQYLGRNGEILSRSEVAGSDQFAIPDHLKELGWDYQWLTEALLGDKDIVRRHNNVMYQNGWRPVSATGRWNGVFFPPSYTGHVIVSDSGLYERPAAMSEEAKAKELEKARSQMQDRDQALMGGKANVRGTMENGFTMNPNRYRGTGADLRMSIDPALDVPAPSHTLAEPGE